MNICVDAGDRKGPDVVCILGDSGGRPCVAVCPLRCRWQTVFPFSLANRPQERGDELADSALEIFKQASAYSRVCVPCHQWAIAEESGPGIYLTNGGSHPESMLWLPGCPGCLN